MTKTWEEEFEKNIHVSSDMMTGNKYCSVNQVKGLGHGWVAPEDHQARVDELIAAKEKNIELLRKNSTLKSQLQQQALPVVPECVAEWIECVKGKNNNALALLDDDNMPDDVNEWLFFQRNDDNINLILRAWLDYTVEKPQQKRYEVKLLSGESMYFNPIGNPKNIKDYRFSFGNYAGWKGQFTKSELSEIKDGMFLKRIPGGTPLDDLGKDKSCYVWIEDSNYWKNPFIELVPAEDGE